MYIYRSEAGGVVGAILNESMVFNRAKEWHACICSTPEAIGRLVFDTV